ncbi:MAG: N-acetylglucosamine-6-phosphate deacetylase [Ruminococcaceae bacterium]|nr:N-acetylglucosamine-6-phosphate deacetylase [Oscillospiraceae bacterium]
MAEKILKNVCLNGILTDIVTENGKILSVGKTDRKGIDCGGYDIYPGLFDIHIHGAVGVDTMDYDLKTLARYEKAHGTTSFLATTTTMPYEELKRVCENIPSRDDDCAKIEGIHLEGPCISEKAIGAQNPDYIQYPDIEKFEALPNVKMITIAPEIEGALDFIKKSSAVISIGHTRSDYDTAIEAIKCGAKCLSHTFNAMPSLHHREPSVIGAAFDANIYAQLISDGVHVHPSAVRILFKLFGSERVVLISDSTKGAGLGDDVYEFGAQKMIIKDGIARTESGALCGSTTPLWDCVKKAIEFGIPKEDAFRSASYTPACLLGYKKGKIEVGFDAEFVLADKDLNIIDTFIFD